MNVLKSSGKSIWLGVMAVAAFLTAPANAESIGTPTPIQILPMMMSLLVVLVIIILAALLLKKFNLGLANSHPEMKVIASLHLGPKERLVVVEVKGQQQLLGVTANQITLLQTLDEPINVKQMASTDFASKLQQYLKKS